MANTQLTPNRLHESIKIKWKEKFISKLNILIMFKLKDENLDINEHNINKWIILVRNNDIDGLIADMQRNLKYEKILKIINFVWISVKMENRYEYLLNDLNFKKENDRVKIIPYIYYLCLNNVDVSLNNIGFGNKDELGLIYCEYWFLNISTYISEKMTNDWIEYNLESKYDDHLEKNICIGYSQISYEIANKMHLNWINNVTASFFIENKTIGIYKWLYPRMINPTFNFINITTSYYIVNTAVEGSSWLRLDYIDNKDISVNKNELKIILNSYDRSVIRKLIYNKKCETGENRNINYIGNSSYANIINNKYYIGKVPLWIENKNLIKYNINDNKFFAKKDDKIVEKTLAVIKWLDTTKLEIDYELLKILDNIFYFCNYEEKDIGYYLNPRLFLSKKTYDLETIDVENINKVYDISNSRIISSKSDDNSSIIHKASILNLIYRHFDIAHYQYLNLIHVLDYRGRINVLNWTMNYQLDHVSRNLLNVVNTSDYSEIYKKYLNKMNIEFNLLNFKIFAYENIGDKSKDFIFKFINKLGKEILIKNWENLFTENKLWNIENNLELILLIECFIDVAYRFSSSKSQNSWEEDIMKGLKILEEFIGEKSINSNNLKEWKRRLNIKNKEVYKIFKLHSDLKKYINSNKIIPNFMWYNDASSNVIQLLALKIFTDSDFILRVSNIFNNTTEYRDIYEYVMYAVKEDLFDKNIQFNNSEENYIIDNYREIIIKIIDRELFKKIIMPGCYGLTTLGIFDTFNSIIVENEENNELWSKIKYKDRIVIMKRINDLSWRALEIKNFKIKDYLRLVQNYGKIFKSSCYWTNSFGLPISTDKYLIIDRYSENKIAGYLLVLKKIIENSVENERETLKNVESHYLFKKIGISKSLNLEQCLKKIVNKIDKIKNKLKKDDKNYSRKNISINNKNLKIRVKNQEIGLNIKKLSNGLLPNINHSEDSSILMNVCLAAKEHNIRLIPIHDSIGSNIYYSLILKLMFKIENIKLIEKSFINLTFPLDNIKENQEEALKDLNKTKKEKFLFEFYKFEEELLIRKEKFKNIDIKKEIIESKNFFN